MNFSLNASTDLVARCNNVAYERIMRHTGATDNYPELVVKFGSAPHSMEVLVTSADSFIAIISNRSACWVSSVVISGIGS